MTTITCATGSHTAPLNSAAGDDTTAMGPSLALNPPDAMNAGSARVSVSPAEKALVWGSGFSFCLGFEGLGFFRV